MAEEQLEAVLPQPDQVLVEAGQHEAQQLPQVHLQMGQRQFNVWEKWDRFKENPPDIYNCCRFVFTLATVLLWCSQTSPPDAGSHDRGDATVCAQVEKACLRR